MSLLRKQKLFQLRYSGLVKKKLGRIKKIKKLSSVSNFKELNRV